MPRAPAMAEGPVPADRDARHDVRTDAGLADAAASVLYGITAIAVKLAGMSVVPGYASLLATITFLSGVQLTVIGMVGQYVARIYDEVRARPLHRVREARGFAPEGRADAEEPWPGARHDPLTSGQRVPPLPPS
jgi:hypothetical protein